MAPPPKKAASKPRTRRTADEARTAILDAAERSLVASGPAGIRLQEVAADVGVSHPTVLHHFGSREGLVEAVVARAMQSLQAGLLDAVRTSPKGPDQVALLLERVYETMVQGGHARAFLWLALDGYAPTMEQLQVRSFAAAIHEIRRTEPGNEERSVEDTYFTVLLPALALLAMSVTARSADAKEAEGEECGPRRFRAWLAKLLYEHLQG